MVFTVVQLQCYSDVWLFSVIQLFGYSVLFGCEIEMLHFFEKNLCAKNTNFLDRSQKNCVSSFRSLDVRKGEVIKISPILEEAKDDSVEKKLCGHFQPVRHLENRCVQHLLF